VPGPLVLGHSCHFGLGLFVPAGDEKQCTFGREFDWPNRESA
jgi:hypothetical protein